MASGGYVVAKGNKPCIIIPNSWGDYLGEPIRIELESGREIKLDGGTFLFELDVIDKMVRRSRDTFGLAGFKGFVRRKPKWYL